MNTMRIYFTVEDIYLQNGDLFIDVPDYKKTLIKVKLKNNKMGDQNLSHLIYKIDMCNFKDVTVDLINGQTLNGIIIK